MRELEERATEISEDQALWISFRVESKSDEEATRRFAEVIHPLDGSQVALWRSDPDFDRFLTDLPRGKRATFLALSEHLFPAAYRAVFHLLTGKSDWARKNGAELLLKLHGMLVERSKVENSTEISVLVKMLREQSPTPIQIVSREHSVDIPQKRSLDYIDAEVVSVD